MTKETQGALDDLADALAVAGVKPSAVSPCDPEKKAVEPGETDPEKTVEPEAVDDENANEIAALIARVEALEATVETLNATAADLTARLEKLEGSTSETAKETEALAKGIGALARAVRSVDFRATATLRTPVAPREIEDEKTAFAASPWTHEKVLKLIANPNLAR